MGIKDRDHSARHGFIGVSGPGEKRFEQGKGKNRADPTKESAAAGFVIRHVWFPLLGPEGLTLHQGMDQSMDTVIFGRHFTDQLINQSLVGKVHLPIQCIDQ